MEQCDLIRETASSFGISLTDIQMNMLSLFAEEIFTSNRLFNLTGHDSVEKIVHDLIFSSIFPLRNLDVPRGTSFCDLGSGAGVPGVPLAVMRPDLSACLIDSSVKKTGFIRQVSEKLGLTNVSVITARAEDMGRDGKYRETFGFMVSRAMGAPFVVIEVGAPLVAAGGFMYIFSSLKLEDLDHSVLVHAEKLGLEGVEAKDHDRFGIADEGLLFIKKRRTESKYPRRYSVIAREADKIK